MQLTSSWSSEAFNAVRLYNNQHCTTDNAGPKWFSTYCVCKYSPMSNTGILKIYHKVVIFTRKENAGLVERFPKHHVCSVKLVIECRLLHHGLHVAHLHLHRVGGGGVLFLPGGLSGSSVLLLSLFLLSLSLSFTFAAPPQADNYIFICLTGNLIKYEKLGAQSGRCK